MSIRQLPEDVVGKIRSSATITSLNGVVCGLLKNSLDAGATKIAIYIDYARGNCTVEDNGLGISPSEFAEDGGLGKPYYSSKLPSSPGTHGRQGNFLASLAVLSLLRITSHHHHHSSHNSISIHHGKILKRQTPSPPGERFESFDHGTRVSVHDLFGAMPVRVKHRAALFSDGSGLDKEWRHLARDVVGLLLAWQSDVSVTLRETKRQRELRLKPPPNADIVAQTARLFTQVSLADSADAESWVPVSASSKHINLKGCISVSPVATRRSQFMSVGILPIPNDHGNNVLFEEVNKVFKNSSFGIIESQYDGNKGDSHIDKETRSKPRKGVDRWPMFYFRILMRGANDYFDADDVLSQSKGDLDAILNLLRVVSYGFLKKHHMRPQKIQALSSKSPFSTATTTRRSSQASNKRQDSYLSDGGAAKGLSSRAASTDSSIRSDSPFDSWNRVKVGLRTETRSAKSAEQNEIEPVASHGKPVDRLIGQQGKLLRKPFEDSPSSGDSACHDKPHRGEMGHGPADGASESLERDALASVKTTEDSSKTPDKDLGTGLAKTVEKQPSEWLQNVLRSWNNPIFEPALPLLPRVNDESPAGTQDFGFHRCAADEDGGVRFEAASISLHGRVSRAALSEAEVISQVDRKFILMRLPLRSMKADEGTNTSSALVILDQHAANERCRLEDLMAGYFESDHDDSGLLQAIVQTLDRPMMFEVSGREGDLLRQYQEHFKVWGIVYKLQPQSNPGSTKKGRDSCKVTITALPPSILERCRGEPRLVVELMRKEAWKLNDEGFVLPRPRGAGGASGRACTAKFHGCPRGILELLHSRSCRSAIMFNDVLSKEECEQLVRRLARCAFPFQCAHGRPSMVPLVDLGSGCRIGGWDETNSRKGGAEAWKRWREQS